MGTLERVRARISGLRWLPRYGWQRLVRQARARDRRHLIIAVADHFEPSFLPAEPARYADRDEQERRVERWCREYPRALQPWRDADGRPLRHTYFYPAEQYDAALLGRLADHCREGWGEIEVHLHHGIAAPDTPDNTRRLLLEFVERLVEHGCLSRWEGRGRPYYAFVHGNWALANSAGGRYCGVENEMQLLADTGCYADMTLPSAPNPAQVTKINALYECALPLSGRAPHRRGHDLRVGRPPRILPVIIQGPLGLSFTRPGALSIVPRIDNAAVTAQFPPTMRRLRLWTRAGVTVRGRPDWIFVKLHCHGMDPRDETAMHGEAMRRFLRELLASQATGAYAVHFVTAREMMNIALAACDGRDGNPGDYLDYKLRAITPARAA